jgi:hypothetical protein
MLQAPPQDSVPRSPRAPATPPDGGESTDVRPSQVVVLVLWCALPPDLQGQTPSAPQGATSDTILPGYIVDVAAGEYAFRAPDTIAAGLVTFRLRQEGRVAGGTHLSQADRQDLVTHGGDPTDGFHMLWVVQLDSGRTAADLFAAARADAATPWARLLGGPAFAYPPRTTNATMSLAPGNYVLVCYVGAAREDRRRYHFLKGMFRPLTVVPSSGESQPIPAADVVATIDSANRLELSKPVATAGTWRILVRNQGSRRVEFGIVRVHDGHTAEEALAWRRQDGQPPVAEPWGGVVGLARGDSMLTSVELVPGTYLANGATIVVTE